MHVTLGKHMRVMREAHSLVRKLQNQTWTFSAQQNALHITHTRGATSTENLYVRFFEHAHQVHAGSLRNARNVVRMRENSSI